MTILKFGQMLMWLFVPDNYLFKVRKWHSKTKNRIWGIPDTLNS